jgi:hypothetical protein
VTVFQHKFEKHAVVILTMPFAGLAIERLAFYYAIPDSFFENVAFYGCTVLWFGAMMWAAVNAYFIFTQKTNWPRKTFWMIINLIPVLFPLALLLWIEIENI